MRLPMHSYKTNYPNQVHQMNVSISKHFYLLKDNTIKFQEKKFDINWKNYSKTGKRHLVNFLIKDHYSSCFYAELHSIDNMPSTLEFLFRAWSKKDDYEFCGIPKYLILGKKVLDDCPKIQELTKKIESFNLQLAQNGFDTGIRAVRDWESCIRYGINLKGHKTLSEFQEKSNQLCRFFNLLDSGKTEPNLKRWAENIERVKVINDRQRFLKLVED